jgi:ABC-type glycerol-3-phosphate transport system permease component
MKVKQTASDRVLLGIIYVIMILAALACLYPLWLVLISSFSEPEDIALGKVLLYPVNFTVESYVKAFENDELMVGYGNSLIYVIFGTIINMALTIPAAYSLSHPKVKGKSVVMKLLVFTMYFSGGLIPMFMLQKSLGTLNTIWSVLLTTGCSTYNMIIARSFFMSGVPRELEEASEIDGCSPLQTFVQIVLPLSKAMLSVILLYYAVARWNDYTSSLYYQPSASHLHGLQMVMRGFINRVELMAHVSPEAAEYWENLLAQLKYSTIVIASLPLLIIYPFIQKYFEKGVMLGSVKG